MMPDKFEFTCPAPLAARGFAVRPVAAADETALRALYRRHRWHEFAPLELSEAQLHALLDMQYSIQTQQYTATYRNPDFHVVERDEIIAGRLMLGEAEQTLRILDILIDPAWRGQGIGSALLAGLLDQARDSGWTVSLHVDKANPARRLYERLGFRISGDIGIAFAMHWGAQPGGQLASR